MTDWMQASLKWQKSAAGRRRQYQETIRQAPVLMAGDPTNQARDYADVLSGTRPVYWFPIPPVAKPRMTQQDKWKKRPAVLKYRAFKDACRHAQISVPDHGGTVIFCLQIPKSYSATVRKQYEGMMHDRKPDLDNLIKALLDATKKRDQTVSNLSAHKIWSAAPGIFVIWPRGNDV